MSKIRLNSIDIDYAQKTLKCYTNPVIIVANCSKRWKNTNEMEIQKWNEIIDILHDANFTPLQFGNVLFTPLDGAIHFRDHPIRLTAAIYSKVGKYIGVNTGNQQLMYKMNGRSIIFVPDSNTNTDKERIKYIRFNNYSKIKEILNFLTPE